MVYTFTRNGNDWQADADIKARLTSILDANGNLAGWTFTTEEQEVEQYDFWGHLISVTDRIGLTTLLEYSKGGCQDGRNLLIPTTGAPSTTCIGSMLLIKITDPFGHSIQLDYDSNYFIARMTDPIGKVYRYSYDGNGNLASVTYPDDNIPSGVVRTYSYGEAGYISATPILGVSYTYSLTGIIDENGDRYATYTYDSQGRAISTEHGNATSASGADKVSFIYNTDGTTTVTDALNTTFTDSFQTVLGVVKGGGANQPAGPGIGAASSSKSYDTNGNLTSFTDFNGNKTCYTFDLARNLETKRVGGLHVTADCATALATPPAPTTANPVRVITTQWHAILNLPAAIAEPRRITSYIYNGDVVGTTTVTCGNKADGITPVPSVLCRKTIQATTDTTGALGLAAAAAPTPPRVTNYTYNAAGQVLTVDGPRIDVNDITNYEYDTQGNLWKVTLPMTGTTAHTTKLENYDANGRPHNITDANNLITLLDYDARGRLASRNAGGETTSYAYDGVGQLITVTTPGGAVYNYTYDAAHRLTDIADNLGNRIHYTLDAMGNRTREETFDAASNIVQTHSRQFDALNRLWKDIGAVNQTTTYEYDANGNLTSITDPLNRLSSNAYDALNRLISSTDPATGVTGYGYDGLDQLVQVTDPKNLVTQYTRDGLGNLNQQVSPDTGITDNTHDAAGNLLTRTDAKGQTATYSYDALNRVTGISYTGGTTPAQTVSYQYDQGINGIGHLTGITDHTGTTSYSYDQHGRLTDETKVIQGATYTTAYAYDAQGRMSSITYPSGRTANYSFDGMGRISQITTSYNGVSQVLVSNINYEPFGGVHSYTYGDGLTAPVQTYIRNRDQDGRIASYTLNGQAFLIGYDAASQVSFIADPQNLLNPANYNYDALSRLTGYTQGSFGQSYSYDANGNRLDQTIGSTITTYGYAATSNHLNSIQVGTSTPQAVTRDAIGATTSDLARQYAYDLRGRLTQTTTVQGVINYEVNALGLRVRKQVPYVGSDTLYHYDNQGHLIAENENGSTHYTREYIYLGDQPVAVMR